MNKAPPIVGSQQGKGLDPIARGGLTAALRVARRLGIAVTDPRILSDDQNLIVHLAPVPVVARVATRIAWSRPDPAAWLARELAVASHAKDHGGPVVPPADLVDPGPHSDSGFDMTLWTFVRSSSDLAPEAVVGESLALLHLSLRDFPADRLPRELPVHAQIENGLSALRRQAIVDADTFGLLARLHEELSAVLAGIEGASGVIHGDAHPWNLLSTDAGWRWIDMEETGLGPQEFDLAVLASKVDNAEAALARYASVMGRPPTEERQLGPFQRIRELETVVWGLGMAATDPKYEKIARDRLARLVSASS